MCSYTSKKGILIWQPTMYTIAPLHQQECFSSSEQTHALRKDQEGSNLTGSTGGSLQ